MPDPLNIEISLPLSDIERVVRDPKIRDLVDSCAANEPGRVGECVQDLLLERLIELYTEDEPELLPMKNWIADDPDPSDEENCRPCALPVTITWYADELKERGRADLADELERTGVALPPLTVAEEMDRIKAIVEPETRARLEDFDKATQVNSPS